MGLAHSSKRAHIMKELERYARALNQTNTLTQSFWQKKAATLTRRNCCGLLCALHSLMLSFLSGQNSLGRVMLFVIHVQHWRTGLFSSLIRL